MKVENAFVLTLPMQIVKVEGHFNFFNCGHKGILMITVAYYNSYPVVPLVKTQGIKSAFKFRMPENVCNEVTR